jgi:hypothetical protein
MRQGLPSSDVPPSETRSTRRVIRLASVILALLVGCSAPPSSSPPQSPRIAEWPRAEVEQPPPLTAQPSSSTSFCSPCHPPTITQMRDVVHAKGGWLAVGSMTPQTAVIWSSADGRRWVDRQTLPRPEGVTLASLTTSGDAIVAVGNADGVAAAWRSTDGSSWTRSAFDHDSRGSLSAVVATGRGFVGAGYAGEQNGPHRAAFWMSPDGVTWTSVPDEDAFDAASVNALAAFGDAVVAVGATIDGSALSWVAADGGRWTRAPSAESLSDATMLAVAAFGRGLVAVGTTRSGEQAVAWTSADGLVWKRSPDAATLHSQGTYAPHAEMSDLAVIDDRLLAVGWNSTASNGSAVVWTSPDAAGWSREADGPGLSGGGMSAVAVGDDVVVAVGSTGWPDTHAATAWRHDLR